MSKDEKDLYYLNELSNYKVASDYPDVRGWKVVDKSGREVGDVDNLLVSKKNERVVYLDIKVDQSIIEANHKPYSSSAGDGVHEFLNKEGENHLILPIGLADLDTNKKIVSTTKIDHQTFAETKRIEKGTPVYREYEVVILDSYTRDTDSKHREEDELYQRSEFRHTT